MALLSQPLLASSVAPSDGIEQSFVFLAIVALAASQAQRDRTTVSVNEGMAVACESSSRTSDARS